MDAKVSRAEGRGPLSIRDRRPVENVGTIWDSTTQLAIIGTFVLLSGVIVYLCRPLLLPIVTAIVVGTTLAPLMRHAHRLGVPNWLSALGLVAISVGVVSLTITMISGPIGEWVTRAPQIGATIREKFSLLERPLAAMRSLQEAIAPPDANNVVRVDTDLTAYVTPIVAVLTPALGQAVLFFAVLTFFLLGQMRFRRKLVALFPHRDSKLRFLRIVNDVERNLSSYLATVTIINIGLGIVVGLGAWALGMPNPLILGILAGLFNYAPYIGSALTALMLLVVALMSFDSLAQILAPPILFLCVTTIEGQFLTPAILGRRLTLDPMLVVLALAFWTWMWGPVGALLAVPLLIIGLITLNHLIPDDERALPFDGTSGAPSH